MDKEQAPRQAPLRDDPADPVTGTPEEVAAAPERDPDAAADATTDPNRKADTTREAAVPPPD